MFWLANGEAKLSWHKRTRIEKETKVTWTASETGLTIGPEWQ